MNMALFYKLYASTTRKNTQSLNHLEADFGVYGILVLYVFI